MDGKGKKVYTALLKGGEQDAFDVSVTVKMEEDDVLKILESLEKEGAVTQAPNAKGTPMFTAVKDLPTPAKPAKPEKVKKPAKEDTLDDIGGDDDDDDDMPKASGGGGLAIPALAAAVLAIVLAVVAIISGGGGVKAEDFEALQAQVTKLEGESAEKIRSLELETKALRDSLNTMSTEVNGLRRIVNRRLNPTGRRL